MSLAWIESGEMPSDEELRRRYSPVANLELARVAFEAQIPLLQGAVIVDVEEEGPRSTAVLQTVARGRMRLSTVVDDEGRIKGVGACQDPEGVAIRPASAADGPQLAELCRTVPIETPGRRTWLDYGDDYLAATALCQEREVLIAELDGTVVGLQGLAYHPALIAGSTQEAFYLRHTRVAPAAKGTGVFSALNGRVFERTRVRADVAYSIVAVGNDEARRRLPAALRQWTSHRRFHLSCRALSGPPAPNEHVARNDDTLAALTSTYGDHLLFHPFDHARLEARLTTSDDYDADRVLATDDAILGVSRRDVQTTIQEDGRPARTMRQATAVDVGYSGNNVDALLRLIASWCTRLADDGVTTLNIAATTGTPLCDALTTIAEDWTDYAVNLGLPEAMHARVPSNVYIDQALV